MLLLAQQAAYRILAMLSIPLVHTKSSELGGLFLCLRLLLEGKWSLVTDYLLNRMVRHLVAGVTLVRMPVMV